MDRYVGVGEYEHRNRPLVAPWGQGVADVPKTDDEVLGAAGHFHVVEDVENVPG